MKHTIGRLIGFSMMFVVCFVVISLVLIAFPVFASFVFWDLSPLTMGWDVVFLWARLIAVFSTIMGIMFSFSEEGQAIAKHYEETGEW